MRKNHERLMRDLLAALIGSKLSVVDLRKLADLLSEDSGFRYEFSNVLHELSYRIGSQSSLPLDQPRYVDEVGFGGLTDLAYSVVQRRRISKAKLFDIYAKLGIRPRTMGVSPDASVREIIGAFLEAASSEQMRSFMEYLGLDVSQDAYLGVIGRS